MDEASGSSWLNKAHGCATWGMTDPWWIETSKRMGVILHRTTKKVAPNQASHLIACTPKKPIASVVQSSTKLANSHVDTSKEKFLLDALDEYVTVHPSNPTRQWYKPTRIRCVDCPVYTMVHRPSFGCPSDCNTFLTRQPTFVGERIGKMHHDRARAMQFALQRLSLGAPRGMRRSDKRAKKRGTEASPRESNGWYARDSREN